eukprot:jgi/Mesvir1/27468/Mv07245-RA.1
MSPAPAAMNKMQEATGIPCLREAGDEQLKTHRKIWISDLLTARASPDGAFFFGQPAFKFKSVRILGTVLFDTRSRRAASLAGIEPGPANSIIIDDSTGVLAVDLGESLVEQAGDRDCDNDVTDGASAWILSKLGGSKKFSSFSSPGLGDTPSGHVKEGIQGPGQFRHRESGSGGLRHCWDVLRNGWQGEFLGCLEEVCNAQGDTERRLRCTGFQMRLDTAFEIVRWFEMMQLYKDVYFPALWGNVDTIAAAKRACGVGLQTHVLLASVYPFQGMPGAGTREPARADCVGAGVADTYHEIGNRMIGNGAGVDMDEAAPDERLLRGIGEFVVRAGAAQGGGVQGVSYAELRKRFVGGEGTGPRAESGRDIGPSCSSAQLAEALNELMDTGVIYTSKQGGLYFPL